MPEARDLPDVVARYIAAYNRKDVDALLDCLAGDVRFENVSNAGGSMAVEGKAAFAELARQSAAAFAEREQIVRRAVVSGDEVAVEIGYRATVAADLPNGMKAGQVLDLRGVSFFRLEGGRIAEVVDFS
jgi:steroid delta-isomerase-like uncharacterized protein